MRALGTNRVELPAGADEQDILIANAAGERLPVRNRRRRNTARQINVGHVVT